MRYECHIVGLCLCALSLYAAPMDGLSRIVTFPAPSVEMTAEGWCIVGMEGCEPDVRTALPILPAMGVAFDIPAGREVESVTVVPMNVREIPLAAPVLWGQPPRIPGAGPQPDVPPDPAVYGGDAPYPDYASPEWRTDPTDGGVLLSMALHPVRYDPVRNLLLAAESIAITVRLRDAPLQRGARAVFAPQPESVTDGYLVISTSNLIHNAPGPWNLQALCAARDRAGFTTQIVDVAWIEANYPGTNTPMRIRAFLQNVYQQWNVRYLVIAGTFDLIPVQKFHVEFMNVINRVTADIPADAIYYGCMDGSFDGNRNGVYGEFNDGEGGGDVDLTAEIMVGRFPVTNVVELANMVRKTLRHESATAAEIRPNGFVAERMDMGTLIYGHGFMEELRYGTNTYGITSMGYENSPYAHALDTGYTLYDAAGNEFAAQASLAFLNRNYLTVNHIGHGAVQSLMKIPFYDAATQAKVAAFTNTLPWFIYSQACNTGAFDSRDCAAEQLVTVSNAASAAIMNAREGWEYGNAVGGYSHRFHRAFWDAAFRGNALRLGEINELSRRMNLSNLSTSGANFWRYVYYELNLFGDPATLFAPAINFALPEIVSEPLINTFETQIPYRVTCTVGPVGVYDPDAIRLVWRTDRAPALVHTQAMTQVALNQFEGFITPQLINTRISYAIIAANHAGFTSRFPAQDDAVFHVTRRLEIFILGDPVDAGTVTPDYGTVAVASGQVVHASAPLNISIANETRYTCVGYSSFIGFSRESNTNAVTFEVSDYTWFFWRWGVEHRFLIDSAHPAFPTQSIWQREYTSVTVPAAPPVLLDGADNVHMFAEWRLDGVRVPVAPAASLPAYGSTVYLNKPHTMQAIYLPVDQDADGNGIADWWQYRYFGANPVDLMSDHDGDGYTLAEEFADRSDPLDWRSYPTPPKISHTPIPVICPYPGPFTILAKITDTHRVANAEVTWRRNNANWQTTSMTLLSNDLFSAVIGIDNAPGDIFEYDITASDPSGNTAYARDYFFILRYPAISTSYFSDIDIVTSASQTSVSNTMRLLSVGNTFLNWSMSVARRETFRSDKPLAWDFISLGQPWAVSTNRAHSAPRALHAKLTSRGLPNTPERATVTLAPTLIGANASLTFNYWIHSELDTVDPTRAFDAGIVEYSLDNGVTFRQLRGPYTHTVYGWGLASPWDDGTPCFAGDGTEGWRTATFDFAALYPEMNGFLNRTVIFRFHYGGDNNSDNEGWYIDDVTLKPVLWQNGFASNITPLQTYTTPAADFVNTTWINYPAGMTTRDENFAILIESDDLLRPQVWFDWSIRLRDAPRITPLTAAQTTLGDGIVNLTAGIADTDGEPVDLTVLWSDDDGATWQPAPFTNAAASFGDIPAFSGSGTVADLPTALDNTPSNNFFTADWASRAAIPPIAVNTQMLFRVIADNGHFRATNTTPRFTVDNVPPVFLPGALIVSPMSEIGSYAITVGPLTLAWPSATDNLPASILRYRLTVHDITNATSALTTTVNISNALDTVHNFRVTALDPAGNASDPLEVTLLILDPLGDPDGDGMTTADEEYAGTDASSPSDSLSATIAMDSSSLTLTWFGVSGRNYAIEFVPSLQSPDWQPVPPYTAIPGDNVPISVNLPTTPPASFFRIRVTKP